VSGVPETRGRLKYEYQLSGRIADIKYFARPDWSNSLLQLSYRDNPGGMLVQEERTTYELNGTTRVLNTWWSTARVYHYNEVNSISRIDAFKKVPHVDQPGMYMWGNRTVALFAYDSNGNRENDPGSATPTNVTPGNRLKSDSQFRYGYDPEGNLERKVPLAASLDSGPGWRYQYDHNGLMMRARELSATLDTVTEIIYLYDAEGKLRERRQTVGGDAVERYVYDGDNIIVTLNAYNEPITQYLRGDGVDQIYAQFDATLPESYKVGWYVTDRQGSVVALYTNDNREIWVGAYANGALEIEASAAPEFYRPLFQYTGRYWDATVQLQNNRARWYDPKTGRWTSEDPWGYAAGDTNLYRYVFNNSANFTDPSGEYAIADDAVAIIGGAVIGVLAQGIGDLIHGEFSGWEAYVGAAVGGAAYGETLLYTGNPWLAGAAAGAAGNATTQGLRILSGKQSGFDTNSFRVSTIGGFVGGGIGGRVFSGLAGPGGQATFRAVIGAGIAGGASAGAVSGAFQGALEARQNGNNMFAGTLDGAAMGAYDGGVTGLATAGIVYGGMRAAPHMAAYGRALRAELRVTSQTGFTGFPLEPFIRAIGRTRTSRSEAIPLMEPPGGATLRPRANPNVPRLQRGAGTAVNPPQSDIVLLPTGNPGTPYVIGRPLGSLAPHLNSGPPSLPTATTIGQYIWQEANGNWYYATLGSARVGPTITWRPPSLASPNWHHVETQAAVLSAHNNIGTAFVRINQNYVCQYCRPGSNWARAHQELQPSDILHIGQTVPNQILIAFVAEIRLYGIRRFEVRFAELL